MLEDCAEKRLRWLREQIMFLALSIGSYIPNILSFFLLYVHILFLCLFICFLLCSFFFLPFFCTWVPFWVSATYLMGCKGLWSGRSPPHFGWTYSLCLQGRNVSQASNESKAISKLCVTFQQIVLFMFAALSSLNTTWRCICLQIKRSILLINFFGLVKWELNTQRFHWGICFILSHCFLHFPSY